MRLRGDAERPRYIERLEREIGVIQKMGFPATSLSFRTLSVGLKVTAVRSVRAADPELDLWLLFCFGNYGLDPLEFSLLFERFLNPERVSMPDWL